MSIQVDSKIAMLLWFISTIPFFLSKKRKTKKDLLFLTLFILIILLSTFFGLKTNWNTALIQIFLVVCFINISSIESKKEEEYIFKTITYSGLMIGILTIIQLLQGNAYFQYNRLSYNGNIRQLANAITIPIYYSFTKIITLNDIIIKKPGNKKIMNIIIFSVLIALLMLSGSRGNILALIITMLYLIIKIMKKRNIKTYFSILLILILAFLVLSNLNLDFSVLLNSTTAEERTKIWTYYFNEVFNYGPLRAVFGFGPGLLKRVATESIFQNYYAHSTIFDYFFTFGLSGLVIIGYMIIKALLNAFLNKCNLFYQGLFLLTIFMFLPFGTCNNLLFHVLLGLCCIKKEEVQNE